MYAINVLILLCMTMFRSNAEIGCMDTSYHAYNCNDGSICKLRHFDNKTLHYVPCSCPCSTYPMLDRKDKCIVCFHYHDPRYVVYRPNLVEFTPFVLKHKFVLKSAAFKMSQRIPKQFTCNDKNISPKFEWENIPAGTKSFVLICEDFDASISKPFVHWILYNIPAHITSLPEGISHEKKTVYGTQGLNDFGKIGYFGPCPLDKREHHYYFKLFALDTKLVLPSNSTLEVLINAMRTHILQEAVFVGTHQRKKQK